jgi:sRNA-binding protein
MTEIVTQEPLLQERDLQKLYPAVFGQHIVPFKFGIFDDILRIHDGHVARKTLWRMLGIRTSFPAYIAAVAAGGPRYALDGSISGEVSEEERASAKERLANLARQREASHLEKKRRSDLLKAFERSGLARMDFARINDLPLSVLDSTIDKALTERAERHSRRLQIVGRYEKSGLNLEDYAAQAKMSVGALQKGISKVNQARKADRVALSQ